MSRHVPNAYTLNTPGACHALPPFSLHAPLSTYLRSEARFAASLPNKLPDMVGKLYHTAAPLPFLAAAMGHTALLQTVLLPAALQEARCTRPALAMGLMHDGMLDNEGWTLLMTASCSGHVGTVLMLCQLVWWTQISCSKRDLCLRSCSSIHVCCHRGQGWAL